MPVLRRSNRYKKQPDNEEGYLSGRDQVKKKRKKPERKETKKIMETKMTTKMEMNPKMKMLSLQKGKNFLNINT